MKPQNHCYDHICLQSISLLPTLEKISQKALSILSLLVEKEGWTGKCLIQKYAFGVCVYSRS